MDRAFDGVSRVAQAEEFGAFDDPALFHVQAGNHPFRKHLGYLFNRRFGKG
jgi:hypothetical protein